MKTPFIRKGDKFLPAGSIQPEELESSLKQWLANSFLPLLSYLEKEICRELTLIPPLLSYRILSPLYDTRDVATRHEMNDLVLSDPVCNALMQTQLICTIHCALPGLRWAIGFSVELSEIPIKSNGTQMKCYGVHLIDEFVNLEENLSLETAGVIAQILVADLRRGYIKHS